MKHTILAAAMVIIITTGAYAAERQRSVLTDTQLDRVTAGDSGFSFSGPFVVTSVTQTPTSIVLMGDVGACGAGCSVSVHASTP